MSGKASLRVVELLEKARIEGHWTQVSQVSCYYTLKDKTMDSFYNYV